MKKSACLICFLFLLVSCKRSFQYKLNDFGKFYEESFDANNEAHHLSKCWNGWFELRIRRSTEIIDGIEVRKFELDPDLDFFTELVPEAFDFYCYIAFVDNHRLVFYTPYRSKKTKIRNRFNLYDTKQPHFQRGYYLYSHPSGVDSLGQLHILLENRKRKSKTELIFEVHYSEASGNERKASHLKLVKMNGLDDTQLEGNSSKSQREYKASDLFSFEPTYYLEERRSLELIANKKRKKFKRTITVQIDSIYTDVNERKRFYYYKNSLQFKEALRGGTVRDTLGSW